MPKQVWKDQERDQNAADNPEHGRIRKIRAEKDSGGAFPHADTAFILGFLLVGIQTSCQPNSCGWQTWVRSPGQSIPLRAFGI